MAYPTWDLSNTPGIETAETVPAFDADAFTLELLDTEFIRRNRPCLIKGAVRHSKAHRAWNDLDYLRRRGGDENVLVHTAPKLTNFFNLRPRSTVEALAKARVPHQTLPLRDVLERLDAYDFLQVQLPIKEFGADVGEVSFVTRKLRPSPFYPDFGLMMHKKSLSGWHFHPFTEAFMCQLGAPKRVVLGSSNSETWKCIYPAYRASPYAWSFDTGQFPEYRAFRPYVTAVEPGDALYIPVWWWHIVSSITSDLGFTISRWWDAPAVTKLNPKYPATRHALKYSKRRYLMAMAQALAPDPLKSLFQKRHAAE
jgi:hypothetical protein